MVTILREADRRPAPEVAKRHGVSALPKARWCAVPVGRLSDECDKVARNIDLHYAINPATGLFWSESHFHEWSIEA